MKNLFIKTMVITIMAINPSYITRSSDLMGDIDFDIKCSNLSKILHEKIIIDSLILEHNKFNTTLIKYDSNISKSDNKINIEFIENIKCYAMDSESLPSIVIAQAIIETGFGRSKRLKNNLFGIKGKGIKSKTKEFVNGRYISINSEFQHFNELQNAFDRHYDIIIKYGYQTRNYREWAFRIKQCGYATDPKYAHKLIYIIKKYDLSTLDRIQELNKKLNSLNNI